jgi:hypothetical protein
MRVKILENLYEICESRSMYGVEIWGLEEGWKRSDAVQGRFCKKVLWILSIAANGAAVLELERDSRRGKVSCLVVK